MTTNDNLIEVLNDLVEINNDRINGYMKASEETKDLDADLRAVFHKMADQSRNIKSELTEAVLARGGKPAEGTTNSGKIYRVWMDVKATFTGHDRQSALESCEFGEDAAQKAYKLALNSDADMDPEIRSMITNQQSELKTSHDLIKKYRDAHKAMS